MKRHLIAAAIALIAVLVSCVTPPESKPVASEAPISAPEWTLAVSGLQEKTLDSNELAEALVHDSHRMDMTLETRGETHDYVGLPFRMIAAMVDAPAGVHPGYRFDQDAWEEGYDITLTAADGYSSTFNTADVDYASLMLTATQDGEAVSPRIVGEVRSSLWVKDLVSIDFDLGDAPAMADERALTLTVNGESTVFPLADLVDSPWYIEGRGGFTTSAGTNYTNDYGGIRFADFLRSAIALERDSMVTLVASDGYEMSYSGEDILDESDGLWILAFTMDGEAMPLDPGYVRTVKIAAGDAPIPNIEGHSSVKMISEIRLDAEPYRDFSLRITGMLDFDIDRQTMQSGVSCHSRTVTYYNRRSEEDIQYTGIPLWLLMAYSDDPHYAPHRQDSSIISYNAQAALDGYTVVVTATDGFSITMSSQDLHRNNDVILAMYRDGEELSADEFPLIIVWDKDAELVPEGIKAVRNIESIEIIM